MTKAHDDAAATTREDDGKAEGAPRHFIREIINDDNKSGKFARRVATRFPPEPNGYLHIGHAKSICLNFGLAAEFGGTCNLRFDDTNPIKEEQEYIDAIEQDVRWLGFEWAGLYFASEYFEQMYRWAELLVTKGKAYVCDCISIWGAGYHGVFSAWVRGVRLSAEAIMSTPAPSYGHVFMDGQGRACVGPTAMPVIQLVAEQAAYGWSPEELHFQHPDVSLSQVHSALAFYWDHAGELDAAIEAQVRELAQRVDSGRSPLGARLRAAGLL